MQCFIFHSCSKPSSYPLDVDMDAFFLSHIVQYTAVAEILQEFGVPLVGEQEWDTRWEINPSHPDMAIDSTIFLNYFTKEQWQIVSDAYHLTEPSMVTYYKSTFSYLVSGQSTPCIAPGSAFHFVVEDTNGKIATVSYVYKPTPGGEAQHASVMGQMIVV